MTSRRSALSSTLSRLTAVALLSTASLTACGGVEDTAESTDEIIGGTTESGSPMVVALLIREGQSEGLCTASVISPTVLLTAAHCVVHPANTNVTFAVVQGPQLTRGAPELAVKRVAFDERYNGNNINAGHDAAVVVLQQPIDVAPVAFNRQPLTRASVGASVRLVGYGISNSAQQTGAGVKRQTTTKLNSYNNVLVQIGDRTHDTCNGDSGGPAFIKPDPAGPEIIVGITSFGSAACIGDGEYTRVDAELDFIDAQLALEAPAVPPPDPDPKTPPDNGGDQNPPVAQNPGDTKGDPRPSVPTPVQTPTQVPNDPNQGQDEEDDPPPITKATGFTGETVGGGCTCLAPSAHESGAAGLLLLMGIALAVRPKRRD